MPRISFLAVLFITSSVYAQVTGKFMGEILKQYEKCSIYLQGVNGSPSGKDTEYLVPQSDRFTAMASSVYEDADLNQKKMILYYKTMLDIRMGYMYAEGHYYKDAYYRYYKTAAEGMRYITQPRWFPLKYQTDSMEYTLDRTYVTQIESLFYLDLLNTALISDDWAGARGAYNDMKASTAMSHYNNYVASSAMISFMVKHKKIADMVDKEKDDLFELYADNIRQLGAFDNSDNQKFAGDPKIDYEKRCKEVLDLTRYWETNRKANADAKLGAIFWYVKDTVRSRSCFTDALNAGFYFGTSNMDAAADVAIATQDKDLCVKVAENLKEDPGIDKECYWLMKIADLYETAGNLSAAKEYRRKSHACAKSKH
ncbi:MAG: hypothetical protein ACKOU7_12585 [Ferruginibacter sp.]